MYVRDPLHFVGVWDSVYLCNKRIGFLPRVMRAKFTVLGFRVLGFRLPWDTVECGSCGMFYRE